MAELPIVVVRQPLPHDIVDDPVQLAGIGTGFEGVLRARVRDANGAVLVDAPVRAGANGVWGNIHTLLDLPRIPATAAGTLDVFGESGADGSPIGLVRVPVIFGRALLDPYHGFAQHTVVRGETLSAIAQQVYGDAARWRIIFAANQPQLSDPNLIHPGQVLRIPQ